MWCGSCRSCLFPVGSCRPGLRWYEEVHRSGPGYTTIHRFAVKNIRIKPLIFLPRVVDRVIVYYVYNPVESTAISPCRLIHGWFVVGDHACADQASFTLARVNIGIVPTWTDPPYRRSTCPRWSVVIALRIMSNEGARYRLVVTNLYSSDVYRLPVPEDDYRANGLVRHQITWAERIRLRQYLETRSKPFQKQTDLEIIHGVLQPSAWRVSFGVYFIAVSVISMKHPSGKMQINSRFLAWYNLFILCFYLMIS